MTVSVVVPTWTGDEDKALAMFQWIAELGRVDTKCILLCSDECNVQQLIHTAQTAFSSVEYVRDHINRKSNWSSNDPGARDASGPNSMFEQAAWIMHVPKPRGPWLWLEPDCRPLTRDWFTVLKAEYEACGKPVMGDYITANSPHMSGVAIYPDDVPQRFPKMIFNAKGAFDVADAANVIEQAHATKRIQDCFRTELWTEETFSKIRPEAVLFCGTKSDTLLTFLRRKLGMKGGDAVCAQSLQSNQSTLPTSRNVDALLVGRSNGAATFNPESAPFVGFGDVSMADEAARNIIVGRPVKAEPSWPAPAPVIDIFIKSYPADYELLWYALESIERFATGFRKVVVVSGDGAPLSSPWLDFKFRKEWRTINDKEPGYAWQQVVKLTADQYTDAQFIWFHDSDTILTRSVDASELFLNGKPYWLKTPYGDARPDQLVWKPIQEAFVGKPAAYELMRRHDFLVHRSWLEKLREFCEIKHDKTIEQYIMGKADPAQPLALCFSEFNVLGHFLHERHPELVSWVDTTKDQVPPEYCLQGFTHGGRKRIEDDIAKFKEILGENEPPIQELEKLTFKEIMGTEEITTADAIAHLVKEAAISPGHKGGIVRKFNAAMASVKPKMPEGFGRGRKKVKNNGCTGTNQQTSGETADRVGMAGGVQAEALKA